MMIKESEWTVDSWQLEDFVKTQQPDWNNQEKLQAIADDIKILPPLVFAGEIRELKQSLADVIDRRAFLLHAGSCAESFQDCNAANIRNDLKVFLQMALILTYSGKKPIVKIGRIAGQFAKPRSSPVEKINGIELPSYRGDMINKQEATKEGRIASPENLLKGYFYSAATLNLLRAFTKGGFASLEYIHQWNNQFIKNTPEGKKYERLTREIEKAIKLLETIGVKQETPALNEVKYYTSHEALILEYEEALTRRDSLTGLWYNCSAHMLWVGNRTKQANSAHIEFLRGIGNPIGIKVGSNYDLDEIMRTIDILNPTNEKGKIIIITRMGQQKIAADLPPLIRKVNEYGNQVLWSCDPMHGNTYLANGIKTRSFDAIVDEVKSFFKIHQAEGTYPGGIHLELTGQNVTECVGGIKKIDETQLHQNYLSSCDPRLNAEQGIELAFQIASFFDAVT